MASPMTMTEGKPGKNILRFALPLALTGILQQLFNAADVAVVGRFASKYAMAAVGSNAAAINFLVTLFIGISLGANVVIARCIGEQNFDRVSRGVHTALVVAVLGGLLAAGVGEALAVPILHIMKVPANVFSMALGYLRIYLAGLPVILLYNFASAVFRARGDTRSPLIALVVSGVLNVLLNLFFVLVCHMDADGVALATVLSNVVSAGVLVGKLARAEGPSRLQWKKLRIDGPLFSEMLRIGIPSGVQGMVFSLSNIIIQSAVNSTGAEAMAATSAALNIEFLAWYVVNSFGQANTTFVSQNYGARRLDRCKEVTRVCFAQDLAVTAVLSLAVWFYAAPLIRIFNTDPAVVSLGVIRLRTIVGSELINVVIEILSGAMRGYGHSLTPALLALLGVCGVRIVYVYTYFATHRTFATLMAVYPISWAVTAAGLVIAYFVFRKRSGLSTA